MPISHTDTRSDILESGMRAPRTYSMQVLDTYCDTYCDGYSERLRVNNGRKRTEKSKRGYAGPTRTGAPRAHAQAPATHYALFHTNDSPHFGNTPHITSAQTPPGYIYF